MRLMYVICSLLLFNFASGNQLREKRAASCDKIDGFVGKIKYRNNKARFKCPKKMKRLGPRALVCLRDGTWNKEPPVCIAPGCVPLDAMQVDRLHIEEANRDGSLVKFSCTGNFHLLGEHRAYCNGHDWSAPLPYCAAPEELMECDFEKDLCAWTQDPTAEQEWQRNMGATTTGKTGPKYDHTYEDRQSGYYLYFETSSPTATGDSARLVSPAFPADMTPMCFDFWYHMLGPDDDGHVGSLEVYVKGASEDFADLVPVLTEDGNHGDLWHRADIFVDTREDSYQIIISARKQLSYISDIAIDDLRLYNCSELTTPTTTPSTTPSTPSTPSTIDVSPFTATTISSPSKPPSSSASTQSSAISTKSPPISTGSGQTSKGITPSPSTTTKQHFTLQPRSPTTVAVETPPPPSASTPTIRPSTTTLPPSPTASKSPKVPPSSTTVMPTPAQSSSTTTPKAVSKSSQRQQSTETSSSKSPTAASSTTQGPSSTKSTTPAASTTTTVRITTKAATTTTRPTTTAAPTTPPSTKASTTSTQSTTTSTTLPPITTQKTTTTEQTKRPSTTRPTQPTTTSTTQKMTTTVIPSTTTRRSTTLISTTQPTQTTPTPPFTSTQPDTSTTQLPARTSSSSQSTPSSKETTPTVKSQTSQKQTTSKPTSRPQSSTNAIIDTSSKNTSSNNSSAQATDKPSAGPTDQRSTHPEDETLKPLMIGLGAGILSGLIIIGVIVWVCFRRRQFYSRRGYEDELKPITHSASTGSLNNGNYYDDEYHDEEEFACDS